jgi:hypothetical protein
MSMFAKTAAVVLAAAALCGLGVGTAAAATSEQVSGTTSSDPWSLDQERLGLGDGWGLAPGWVEAASR